MQARDGLRSGRPKCGLALPWGGSPPRRLFPSAPSPPVSAPSGAGPPDAVSVSPAERKPAPHSGAGGGGRDSVVTGGKMGLDSSLWLSSWFLVSTCCIQPPGWTLRQVRHGIQTFRARRGLGFCPVRDVSVGMSGSLGTWEDGRWHVGKHLNCFHFSLYRGNITSSLSL